MNTLKLFNLHRLIIIFNYITPALNPKTANLIHATTSVSEYFTKCFF
jgi:hypothetical protein